MKIEKVEKVMRYKLPRWVVDPLNEECIEKCFDSFPPGRPFVFKIERFLTVAEMVKIGYLSNEEKKETIEKIPPEQKDLPF